MKAKIQYDLCSFNCEKEYFSIFSHRSELLYLLTYSILMITLKTLPVHKGYRVFFASISPLCPFKSHGIALNFEVTSIL